MAQLKLFPEVLHHGADFGFGKRKGMRPLDKKKPMHLTLKAKKPLRQELLGIEELMLRMGRRFGLHHIILVVAYDHIHTAIEIPSRKAYNAYIRAVTGLIARRLGKGLWDLLPMTRITFWGKPLDTLIQYIFMNDAEEHGQPKRKRVDYYRKFRPKPR
jgi:hypothetical protein